MRALRAGAFAAVVSGAPSTVHALATGADPWEATRAAGRLVAPRAEGPALHAAAGLAHGALSLGWAVVLSRLLPARRTVAWGALAGLGIAAFDLGVVGSRVPAIRALPTLPQVADHVAYGAAVGWVLSRDRGPGA